MTEQILEQSAPSATRVQDFDVQETAPTRSVESATATGESQDASGTPLSSKVSWGDAGNDDFDYIPVSPWAPVALGLGLLGLTGFLGIFGLYVAFFGIFVGIAAVARIRAAAGEAKGSVLAIVGLVLSAASFLLGSAKMAHAYSTEVPEGFQRVNFPRDVAEKQFLYIDGHRKLHPDVASLIDQKVYLKGFMWATQDTEGLTQFILLKDNGECCFGGKPKAHDYIWVKLPTYPNGQRPAISYRSAALTEMPLTDEEKQKLQLPHDMKLTTKAYLGMVAVAGVLHADVTAGENGAREDYEFAAVYSLDAELVEEAWTRF